ncbi:tetratricopeptide repeat protein [Streptomyces sp. WAC05374]|uniref:tetratricopeptide repeat protein n=1 Tax=Streptomyces sp. WAC05374 TaxID=2487420 RepID=UPI000F86B695|nr:tetratricopeptide repeat protein [Streptomyces sp. WAC05374]RST19648.1 tetratricopeptide repeat protein [Streptomyces sp. WAC05374]TDF50014.1 tetratricopeptide repeat protein [Streptomyces sp. WAC05374]TDF57741.1 tetratricopeptide repeat protein [Streptomyces sp. WAC05374]TDF60269.1 tetratricopeptide repeat protein [Streptomyces sp. WAC05374]
MTDPEGLSAAGAQAAAIGGDNSGIVVTGCHNRVEQRTVVLRAGALRAAVEDSSVARVNNLRAPDSRVFKGREDVLAQLGQLPSVGTGIVAQSVRGMGGVGKSTLALHHARRHRDKGGGPVWWIDAGKPEQITAGLARLAAALDPVHGALPLEDAAQWAVTWLQGRTRWLLVFDNVEEPAHLRPWLGRLSTGQVLITTRRDLPWQDLDTALYLDTLAPEASLAVLRDLTGRRGHDDTVPLADLAEELGHLPLALQQAGAYLAQTRTHPAAYLDRLRTDPATTLATTAPGDPHQRTMARLWNLTLTALQAADPNAVELLRILAYCASDSLPRDVLAPALPTTHAVDQALGLLAAYSMITLTDTAVVVHRLVQAVLRTTTPPGAPAPRPSRLRRLLPGPRPKTAPHPSAVALSLLHRATPSDSPAEVRCWPRWQDLLPHVHAVTGHYAGAHPYPQTAQLPGGAASYLRARGQAAQALPLAERALQVSEAVLGPHHPTTAIHMSNLAGTLGELGRHAVALPLRERASRVTEAALGPGHPATAIRLGNLARTLMELGRYAEALQLAERALSINEATLGPDHPTTAISLGNLARMLGELGRHTDALPLAERALRVTEMVSGPSHPETAARLNILARTLEDLGRHAEALPLAERAVPIAKATLGPDHPATAAALGHLARTLGALGRHTDALPLAERALATTEAALGPDHPDTAVRLDSLALRLGSLGRHTDALPLAERALAITEAALGPNHPNTAVRLGNLARTLSDLGRHADALPLDERALAITEAALGPDHPDTGIRLSNLADIWVELGRHTDALPLAERALAIIEAALGPNHETTVLHRNYLSDLRQMPAGDNDAP